MNTLRLGDSGKTVRWLQGILCDFGYPVKIDGDFGTETEAALKQLQAHLHLQADGIAGPATWGMLLGALNTEVLQRDEDLLAIPLAPITKVPGTSRIPTIINNYGNLIQKVSERLFIDPAVAIALMALESGGVALQGGKPIIRFEAHVFYRTWGKYHKAEFNEHFLYDKDSPWLEQQYIRPGAEHGTSIHQGSQSTEWEAYCLATTLDANAATLSISIGLGQLMGFHYQELGYASPTEMLQAAYSEHEQVLAFFQYIKSDIALLTALQEKDWYTATIIYNGKGQVDFYSAKLKQLYNETLTYFPK